MLSTAALAAWIAGQSAERSLTPDGDAWELLEDIARSRSATADDVSERCEHWRAAVVEVLSEQAAIMGTPQDVLTKAASMANTTLAVNLERVHDAFGAQTSMVRSGTPAAAQEARERKGLPVRAPGDSRKRVRQARSATVARS